MGNVRIAWRRREDAPMHTLELESLAPPSPARVELIPSTEGAMTPKEDALGLLALAAEVEHALMAQYLYAGVSVIPDHSLDDDDEPQRKVFSIAVQEMMHLMGVQNLIIALGGPAAVHIGRDGIRSGSEENPLPFVLEAVTSTSLSKYALVEMPSEVDASLKQRVEKLKQDAIADGPVELNRVGAIYAALEWLFQADDASLGPLNLSVDQGYRPGWHVGDADFQTASVIGDYAGTRLEWRATSSSYILEIVQNRPEAQALLRRIGQQGEGLGEAHDSHFWEFLELLDMLDDGRLKTLPLPKTPYGKYPPAADTHARTEITRPYTRLWSELFDIRYNMMLLDIFQALTTKRADPRRSKHVRMAFENMKPIVKRLAPHLATLPLTDADDGQRAGPSFGLMFQDYPPQADVDAVQRDLVRKEGQVLASIAEAADFAADAEGADIHQQIAKPGGFHSQRKKFFGE